MNEQAKLAEPVNNPKSAGKRNRAWFKPGDKRINRTGRPRKARDPCGILGRQGAVSGLLKTPPPNSGRHMTLFVEQKKIRGSLTGEYRDCWLVKTFPRTLGSWLSSPTRSETDLS
jgi:hypothetical protein